MLVWASRALFGERLGRRDLPRLLREGLPRRILPYLLWRRIGLRRSFFMPLTLLEGLRGTAARRRRQVMANGTGVPSWVTLACYHFEILIWVALLLGIFFLVPEQLPRLDLMAALTDDASWAYWVSVLGYALAFSIVAPFYVCAGFALYLARRTELEAWDLELAFKRAAPNRASPVLKCAPETAALPNRATGTLAAALLLFVALSIDPGVSAANPRTDPEAARALIEDVLAEPDFGRVEEVRIWVPIETPDTEEDSLTLPKGLQSLLLGVARSLKWLLLGLATVAVVLLILRVLRDRDQWRWLRVRMRRKPVPSSSRPEPLTSVDLPEDPAAVARAYLRGGDRRGALSLLYRASLTHLRRLGLELPEGTTEGECLTLATRTLSKGRLGPFANLTQAWQGLAYAHRAPQDDALEALITDWSHWVGESERGVT